MTGVVAGDAPGLTAGDECMALLRELGREEILEVLSEGLCRHCEPVLINRLRRLKYGKFNEITSLPNDNSKNSESLHSANEFGLDFTEKSLESLSISNSDESHQQDITHRMSTPTSESTYAERQKGHMFDSLHSSVNRNPRLSDNSESEILLNDGLSGRISSTVNKGLSEDQKEQIRISQVGRNTKYVCLEKISGKMTNVLQGLELHTRVFNAKEQKKIVDCVYDLQRMGQQGQLRARTYSEPRKWMRGKGRITIQFGCCYNYVMDKEGNPPGIIRDEEVDPLPPLFKRMIKRMVRWHVLPPTCVPNSCIVNIYDEGDCIPPHIDHHDFVRPFCTVSFLSECNIIFGSNLRVVGPGEFSGPFSIPLPVGSVLILNGNGANVAKHCVPGVPAKRISITFRKMDGKKVPHMFAPDPDLIGIKPIAFSPSTAQAQQNFHQNKRHDLDKFESVGEKNQKHSNDEFKSVEENRRKSFDAQKDDFPSLRDSMYRNRSRDSRK